jgi:phosphatidylglycerol lysyltransferase
MEDTDAQPSSHGRLQALIALVLFGAALYVLRRELAHYHYADLVAAIRAIGAHRLALAVALTAINYVALTGYDAWALRVIGQYLAYPRIALASFVAYVFSHNVGLSFLGGGAVRFRLYSSWGLGTDQIASVLALNAITFWLGFLLLLGLTLVIAPPAVPPGAWVPTSAGPAAGMVCIGIVIGYLALVFTRRSSFTIRGREFTLPTPAMACIQVTLSATDWLLAAAVLYPLLPLGETSFAHFTGIFLVAQIAGLASQVPAGVGVFESVMLLFIGTETTRAAVLGGLVAYRVIYYLLPFVAGVMLLAGHEAARRTHVLRRVGRTLDRIAPAIVPQALAFMTFAAGAVLLFSGATPALESRLGFLGDLIGLPIIEMSHFTGSLVGVGLLLLARGLQLRLDAAYVLTGVLLIVGIVASLLKGFDYEEALVLAGALAMLLPCRRHFYRRASLLSEPFSGAWLAAVALVVIGAGWLMLLSFKHVEYEPYLWWQFELWAGAPRALRASAGVLGVLAAYGAARLLYPAAPEPHPPSPEEADAVREIVAASPNTAAHLALLHDKLFLLNEARTAFVMYGLEGRSWIAMGDPVGPLAAGRELAWEFYEQADRHAAWPVFYEVSQNMLPLYLDLGLALLKLGEEARVFLPGFSLEGGARKNLRHAHNRVERCDCTLEIVPPAGVPALIPDLRRISDAWLESKKTREKGFSLGSFRMDYLLQLPIAVVREKGRIVAFANLWLGAPQTELSVDLMRQTDDAPAGVMDYLFIELMLWGKSQGYQWFNFGMAPLSGFEQRSLQPLWNKLGHFVFRHGDAFYNFQGLRQYKEKFDPQWTTRYLASPGGVALPVILANVASVVSRGLTGVVAK